MMMMMMLILLMLMTMLRDLHMVPRGLILQLSQQGPMLHSASIFSLRMNHDDDEEEDCDGGDDGGHGDDHENQHVVSMVHSIFSLGTTHHHDE